MITLKTPEEIEIMRAANVIVAEVLAEQSQPKRRREIVTEVQNLLAELHQLDDRDPPSTELLTKLPAADPARLLRREPFTLDLHTRHALLGDRYVPLLPYGYAALDRMWAHLVGGAALTPGPAPVAQPRGAGKLDVTHLGIERR